MSDVHVIPEHDAMEHTLTRQCLCRPDVETPPNSDAVVIHHAADGREYWEPRPRKEKPQ